MEPLDRVEVDELPESEAIVWLKLSDKFLGQRIIETSALVVFIVLATGISVFVPFVAGGFSVNLAIVLIVVSIFLILIAGLYLLTIAEVRHRGYLVRQDDLVLKCGLLFTREFIIPYDKIQHVASQRGPFDRIFNLSTLSVFTAGRESLSPRHSMPAAAVFRGLEHDTVEELRAYIQDRMNKVVATNEFRMSATNLTENINDKQVSSELTGPEH